VLIGEIVEIDPGCELYCSRAVTPASRPRPASCKRTRWYGDGAAWLSTTSPDLPQILRSAP